MNEKKILDKLENLLLYEKHLEKTYYTQIIEYDYVFHKGVVDGIRQCVEICMEFIPVDYFYDRDKIIEILEECNKRVMNEYSENYLKENTNVNLIWKHEGMIQAYTHAINLIKQIEK